MKVSIYVSPKKGVLDPAGQAAQGALRSLGFGEVTDVQIGKYIILSLDGAEPDKAKARIQEMCERLLANPIIEDYRIEMG